MMKAFSMVAFFMIVSMTAVHASETSSPLSKVLQMLEDLKSKITKEGVEAQKAYKEFSEWCEERHSNVGFEIKQGKAEVADLSAQIEKETSKITAYGTRIEELAASIASDDEDLKNAAKIRASEKADFAKEEQETSDVIGSLERAIAVLNREMAKNGAAMLQVKGTKNIVQAFSTMVQASLLSSADASHLTSLVQNAHQSSEDDDALGAPTTAAYAGHSDSIIATLEDLLEKAESQLDKARKAESSNSHNFAMLKQSLESEIDAAEKDMAEAKAGLAASEEARATAQGDLSVTASDVKEDQTAMGSLHQDCTSGSEDFKAEQTSRGEELKAVSTALKVLADAMPAASQTYGAALDQAASFLQMSSSQLASGADLAKLEAVRFIRDLARKQKSAALAQLASKMASAIRFGESNGSDPLEKVKTLIADMISKLEEESKADLTHQGFCDKEIAETTAKKDEKMAAVTKLGTKTDSMGAKSAKLKEEVASLQKELGELTSSQAQMDKARMDEKAFFDKSKAELQAGISGVQKALSVLRDYYASEDKHSGAASDVGGGIIGLLELVESDFTKGLSEMEVAEATAVSEYEKTTELNKNLKLTKDRDVEYKGKESAGLDKSAAETASDKDGVQAELDALLEYLTKLSTMCMGKAEPYAERKARREAEISGLKEALSILEGEAALLQRNARRTLRGQHSHS
jgi:chromosome segregation ATPase